MTRWLRMTAAMLLLVILFTACGAPAAPAVESVTGETFTDCAGREVPIPDSTERIACLYAYTGHVAVLLGCEEQICRSGGWTQAGRADAAEGSGH